MYEKYWIWLFYVSGWLFNKLQKELLRIYIRIRIRVQWVECILKHYRSRFQRISFHRYHRDAGARGQKRIAFLIVRADQTLSPWHISYIEIGRWTITVNHEGYVALVTNQCNGVRRASGITTTILGPRRNCFGLLLIYVYIRYLVRTSDALLL